MKKKIAVIKPVHIERKLTQKCKLFNVGGAILTKSVTTNLNKTASLLEKTLKNPADSV